MDARKEVVLMARIFGAIAIVVAAMVGLGELAVGAASFSEAHRAD